MITSWTSDNDNWTVTLDSMRGPVRRGQVIDNITGESFPWFTYMQNQPYFFPALIVRGEEIIPKYVHDEIERFAFYSPEDIEVLA